MSIYAVVLRAIKEHPNQTAAQLESLIPAEASAVTEVLPMLVKDGRVTQTGSGSGATYASTTEQ